MNRPLAALLFVPLMACSIAASDPSTDADRAGTQREIRTEVKQVTIVQAEISHLVVADGMKELARFPEAAGTAEVSTYQPDASHDLAPNPTALRVPVETSDPGMPDTVRPVRGLFTP